MNNNSKFICIYSTLNDHRELVHLIHRYIGYKKLSEGAPVKL